MLHFHPILIPEGVSMPQHKSAKKRVKTNLKSQARNRSARSTLKSTLKGIAELKQSDGDAAVRQHQSVLDRASNGGLVHRNKAARLKSRLAKSIRKTG
jgi:small subunit ribosomal protein S20